jgi:hypothetical protein
MWMTGGGEEEEKEEKGGGGKAKEEEEKGKINLCQNIRISRHLFRRNVSARMQET